MAEGERRAAALSEQRTSLVRVELVVVQFDTEVIGVARRGRDLVVDAGRDSEPLSIHLRRRDGTEDRMFAQAVVDASGTWGTPNPLGGEGLPALGEGAVGTAIRYRVPDLDDPAVRAQFAGTHTVIAGSGHSALTAIVALSGLAEQAPSTRITWAVRGGSATRAFGGEDADELPARGALGSSGALGFEGAEDLADAVLDGGRSGRSGCSFSVRHALLLTRAAEPGNRGQVAP